MKKTKLLIFGILLQSSISHGQYWNTNGLNLGGTGNTFGTSNNFPINIYTNSIQRALFTTGSALTTPWDFNGIVSGSGHGLSIQTSSTASGNLDLFTAQQGTTQKNLENR